MTNWRIMGFGVLLLLIFLIIGLNAASAADDDSISNLTDNLETSAVSNSVDGVNSGLSSSETIGSVSESEFDSNDDAILEDEGSIEEIDDLDNTNMEAKSNLGAGEKTVHTVTPENYSKYFDSKGNLNKSLVHANDTINLSGNFSKKNFIINIPITVTSTENDALLKNSPIYFVNVSNQDFKYDAMISNLKIESNIANISAVWIIGCDHIKIFDNDIFTTGHNGYPISLDQYTTDSIVSNNKIRTIVPVEASPISNSQSTEDSDENATDNSSWQHSGISLRDAHRNSIVNNEITVENSYGIYLCYGDGVSDNNTLANNTIRATSELPSFWAGGVYLTGSGNKVLDNTIIGLYRGIDAGGRPNNIIVGNQIYNITGYDESLGYGGDYAIKSSDGSLIANNSIYNADVNQAGILVASNCDVYGNYIEINASGDGIRVGNPEKGSDSKVHNNTVEYLNGAGISIYGDPEDVEIYGNILNSLSLIGASQGTGAGLGIYAVYQSRSKRPYNVSIFDNTIHTNNSYAINIAQLSTEVYLCEGNEIFGKGIIYPMSVIYTPAYGEGNVYEVTENTYNNYFDSDGLKDIIQDGDVLIFTGNFTPKGRLTLNKTVSIIGKKATLFNTTVFVNAPNCKVQNFTIKNNGRTDDNCNLWGIYVFEADNEVISGNNITVWDKNTSYGIYICDSFNNTVSNNRITCEGKNLVFGLLNYEVYKTTFKNNKIKVVGTDEIYQYFDSICIDGKRSIGELTKTYGVIFDFSSDNKFLSNTVNVTSAIKTYQKAYNPSVNILIGLYIYYESNRNLIKGNKIYVKGHDPFLYGMGISGDDTSKSVTQAWNNTIRDNYINVRADYFATGIILRHNSMNTKIRNNTLDLHSLNYTYGLTLEISGGSDVEDNTFKLTGRAGIYATEGYSTWSNKISKNKYFVNGSFSEIGLYASSGNNISDNDIYILSSEKYDPFIGPEHPDSVTLIPTGILLEKGSNGNIISNNRIRTNGKAAITIRGSYGNTVSHNKLYSKNGGGNAAVDDNTGMNNIFGNTGSKFKDPFEKANGNSGGNAKGGDNPNKGSSSKSGSADSSGASSFGNVASNFFANALSSANDGAGDAGSDSMGDGSDVIVSELEEVASKSISSSVYVPVAALVLILIFCFSFLNSKDEDEEE